MSNYDESLVELVRQTLLVTLKIAAPVLLAGVVVGLFLSILQSITSIQEQTITMVPKIVAMVLVAVLLIPWIITKLVEFSAALFCGWIESGAAGV